MNIFFNTTLLRLEHQVLAKILKRRKKIQSSRNYNSSSVENADGTRCIILNTEKKMWNKSMWFVSNIFFYFGYINVPCHLCCCCEDVKIFQEEKNRFQIRNKGACLQHRPYKQKAFVNSLKSVALLLYALLLLLFVTVICVVRPKWNTLQHHQNLVHMIRNWENPINYKPHR